MRKVWLILLMLPGITFAADTVIHRCTQEDGTVAFQETPCAEPVGKSDDGDQSDSEEPPQADEFFEFVNPFDEPEETAASAEPVLRITPSQDRAVCEKTTRDAIDAIDMEMRKGLTKEESQAHLPELLSLTRQLRACKQL